MAKKNKKNKKRNSQESNDNVSKQKEVVEEKVNEKIDSDIDEQGDIPDDKKPESITKRLLKIKSANVFEDITPEEHVDKLKEKVRGSTAQKVEKIGKQQTTTFPWVEFLIGFTLGAVLLIVMFLFHISFAKNVDERIDSLENKLAMWNPIITSSGHENLEVITRQKMFESELNNFKYKLQSLKERNIIDYGYFSWEEGSDIKIVFKQKFKNIPAVFIQTYPQDTSFSINVEKEHFQLQVKEKELSSFSFYWFAVGEHQ